MVGGASVALPLCITIFTESAAPNRVVFACMRCRRDRASAQVSQEFRIRQATPDDVAMIGWHRARMFQDMGLVPDELFDPYRTKALDRLSEALASGDYFGWLVSESIAPEKIIAGAGVIIRVIPPFPHRDEDGRIIIAEGRQGVIVNVFTEPEWRRRGIAKLLMKEIIVWSREQNLDDLVLHASDEGRTLYEQLGFVLTNEMRLRGGGQPA
jgi:GNAT superfamily N-acetyltransferase